MVTFPSFSLTHSSHCLIYYSSEFNVVATYLFGHNVTASNTCMTAQDANANNMT